MTQSRTVAGKCDLDDGRNGPKTPTSFIIVHQYVQLCLDTGNGYVKLQGEKQVCPLEIGLSSKFIYIAHMSMAFPIRPDCLLTPGHRADEGLICMGVRATHFNFDK